jgi:hypothetical protein
MQLSGYGLPRMLLFLGTSVNKGKTKRKCRGCYKSPDPLLLGRFLECPYVLQLNRAAIFALRTRRRCGTLKRTLDS